MTYLNNPLPLKPLILSKNLEFSCDLFEFTFIDFVFYIEKIMPCCGRSIKFYPGPRGGFSRNIKCVWCGTKFNISPPLTRIERI
jgi:hypothetical protein